MSTALKKRMENIKISNRFWMSDAEAVEGIVFILLIIGSLNVFSSSFVFAETNFGTPYFFIKKHLLSVVLGIGLFVVGRWCPYQKWRDWMGIIFFGIIVLLMAVFVVGTEVNGAKRWLSLGFFSIQPAEFAKVVAVFVTASYVSDRIRRGLRCEFFSKHLFFIVPIAVLIEREPDAATAAACLMAPLVLLFLSNMSNRTKLYIFLAIPLSIFAVATLQPYRMVRMMAMINPWAYAQNEGYQTVQSLSAIGSGGFWGMGLGMGISKYFYLPEAHTDFAFAIFGQENGFLGVCFVVCLYTALLVYGLRIANKAPDILGRCLAIGLISLIVMQGLANMAMVAGMGPVIGVPLPFISYGGSSLLASMWAIGIVVNISQQKGKKEQAEPAPAPAPEPEQPRRRRLRGERPYLRRVK